MICANSFPIFIKIPKEPKTVREIQGTQANIHICYLNKNYFLAIDQNYIYYTILRILLGNILFE